MSLKCLSARFVIDMVLRRRMLIAARIASLKCLSARFVMDICRGGGGGP